MTAVARILLAELGHIADTWPPDATVEQEWTDTGLQVRVRADTGGGIRTVDTRSVP